jgi:peptidoglycan/xylan/chitin deacetylase (PgdA/CDA1 family)
MYHFVRDLARSRFPSIKGLDVADFRSQIEYINRHYNVIDTQTLISAFDTAGSDLPTRPLLLTFDDGYIDHFDYVFPILDEHRLHGAFFPPAEAILERRVLDVNKIHFMLASVETPDVLVEPILDAIARDQESHDLKPLEFYKQSFNATHRYDAPAVTFIKRTLQRELPEAYRKHLTDELFKRFVTADEESFAEELYMTPEQLRTLLRHGMHVGSHGYGHYWLNTLTPDQQRVEVQKGMEFLASLGATLEDWVMCYPYGGHDASLQQILAEYGCALGLTASPGLVDPRRTNRYAVDRIDTNDLPCSATAPPNEWLEKALMAAAI